MKQSSSALHQQDRAKERNDKKFIIEMMSGFDYATFEAPTGPRVRPDIRFKQALQAYLYLLSYGHLLNVGHTDIAIYMEKSVATIFNYFRTTELLRFAATEWAIRNVDAECKESRQLAELIAKQALTCMPKSQTKHFKLTLELKPK